MRNVLSALLLAIVVFACETSPNAPSSGSGSCGDGTQRLSYTWDALDNPFAGVMVKGTEGGSRTYQWLVTGPLCICTTAVEVGLTAYLTAPQTPEPSFSFSVLIQTADGPERGDEIPLSLSSGSGGQAAGTVFTGATTFTPVLKGHGGLSYGYSVMLTAVLPVSASGSEADDLEKARTILDGFTVRSLFDEFTKDPCYAGASGGI